MPSEVHCIVSGKVQGVGFRDFVTRCAKEQGIVGSVKNKDDGTVEIVAQGTLDALKIFIELLHEGSVLARVDGVSADWHTAEQLFTDFEVLF